jgi:hypothetical protein
MGDGPSVYKTARREPMSAATVVREHDALPDTQTRIVFHRLAYCSHRSNSKGSLFFGVQRDRPYLSCRSLFVLIRKQPHLIKQLHRISILNATLSGGEITYRHRESHERLQRIGAVSSGSN